MKSLCFFIIISTHLVIANDTIVVDSMTFSTISPIHIGGHTEQYKNVLHIDELFTVQTTMNQRTLEELAALLTQMANVKEQPQKRHIGNLNQIWIFTEGPGDFRFLANNQIKGFFLTYFNKENFTYEQLFFKQIDGLLQPITELSRQVSARTFNTMDTLRALHLACIMPDPDYVPDNSTMYRLTSDTAKWGSDDRVDWHFATQVATHPETKVSRYMSTQYQGGISNLARHLNPEAVKKRFEYYCGEATSMCNADPAYPVCNGRFGRCETGDGGCKTAAITKELESHNLTKVLSKDIAALYYFRDEILAKSKRGQVYINYWYKFSQHIKLTDTKDLEGSYSRLQKYVYLFQESLSIIETIASQDNYTHILISKELNYSIQSLIEDHRGIDPDLDNALDHLSKDLHALTGQSKSTVLSFFGVF